MKNITEAILSKSKLTNSDFIKQVYKTDLDIHREVEDNFDRITLDNIKDNHLVYNNIVNLDVDNLEDVDYHKNILFRTFDKTFSLVFTGKKIQGFKFSTDKMRVFIGKDQELCDCDFENVEDLEFFFYDKDIKKNLLITHLDKDGDYKVNNGKLLQKMFHDNQFNIDVRGKITRFYVGIKRDREVDSMYPEDLGLIAHYLEGSRNNLYPKYL